MAINSVRSEERRAVAAAVERQLPRYVVVVRNCAYKAGKAQVKGTTGTPKTLERSQIRVKASLLI